MVNYNLDTRQEFKTVRHSEGYNLIKDSLRSVERLMLSEPPGQHGLLTEAASRLFRSGGKRLRAAISLLAAGIFNADSKHSVSLAAGVEMLHTATLVHDDLIDGSLLRRGEPTINAGQNANFSVLIGDYFFARAANLVAETNNVDIMNQFAKTLMTILNGEITQQFSRWQLDRRAYFERIYAKTGDLFVLAARAAATLGGADDGSQVSLEKYGYYTGIAFQIIDDVLDFTGEQTHLGKPVGSDLRQGLITLPVLLYADRVPEDPDLRSLLKLQEQDHLAAERLIASIQRSGAIDEAIAEARTLAAQGKNALKALPRSEYTEALQTIADSIIDRNR